MKKNFIIVFLIGGISYGYLELAFRGFTHWSMVMAAGLVFTSVYILGETLLSLPVFLAAFIISLIIIFYEYYYGLLLNLFFKWGIWDYSDLYLNLNGQICIAFFVIWYILSLFFICLIHLLNFNTIETTTITHQHIV